MTSKAQERADRLATLPFQTSTSSSAGAIGGFWGSIKEVLAHRELLDLLIRRELKARYKDSSLGFLWSLIKPLTMLLIYYVAIGQFLGAARGIPDFAIFVFAGLTIWGLYSEIVLSGTMSIIGNAGLIKKVYLPREIFPLAAAGSAIFNFAIQMIVLVAATVVLGQFPLSWNLLYVPVAILIVLVYGVAFAILLSALNVYLRDIQYLVEVAMLLLFWASPIVYAWSYVVNSAVVVSHSWIASLYLLNPVSNAVLAFQKGMWQAGSQTRTIGETVVSPQPWPVDLDLRLLVVTIIGFILLIVCQRVFQKLQGNFAQEI
ncbi:ABC transporter permease [Cryobacterium sp. TMS1-20-1]|uniref:ABC transporter permease n=1 Tax=unclassified Cryobacterium TaxID=2649013 RepID=UPI00106A42A7|nr:MULTISPECIES: ABC transporter permease [unclassified Cryobacterium]TFC72400.1 ABC transporter permease [Cryobacterium sp. TMS1-20-1]TFD55488.1 ABC transporter permease [Cryobacterium sp. Hh7]